MRAKRERIAALESAMAGLTARIVELEARPHLVLKENGPKLTWGATTGTYIGATGLPPGVTIDGNSVGAQ